MKIIPLTQTDSSYKQELAKLLSVTWPDDYPTLASQEIEGLFAEERIALGAIEGQHLIGFVGAIPQYGKTGWELHPLVVDPVYQHRNVGTDLVQALENEVKKQGGITIYLGSDDETSATSLSDTDLYEETFKKISTIKNYKHHPYEFYQKLGYQIVGVFPDVNGLGKPDIWMAKRIVTDK
ncbi:GNAT family N-acetyltransferase [Enterococcus ureasiticus]|uniref:AAC(6')-Ii family aminoglycoside 6'-N-acetyltransferase n=1 Tax=Enterococcus ureasiticus TaxID=903984 RepID=A0A1E5GNH7_9ENTE|nr:GNAT family N-acetyltransferase [Enterococcus ureasiticus]OEG14221.1 AAC(6')-Ii family aminoglycoside 6'-N-acetyltransferase [Enterococcus ureasiticus]